MSGRPTALVTGGAGDIGRAFARRLGRAGYRVVLADNRSDAANAAAAELARDGIAGVTPQLLDVTSVESWEAAAEPLRGEAGGLSLLVHAAGVLLAGRVEECATDELVRVLRVNLEGPMIGSRVLVPLLRESARGAAPPYPAGIVSVASIFAAVSPPGFAAYSASKAGLVALGETLAAELAADGLVVTTVLPGVVRTGLFDAACYADAPHRDAVFDYLDRVELTPDDVASRSLTAHAGRRGVVPIGRRAARYWLLKRWFPWLAARAIAKRAAGLRRD
ncbi:MAG: SDR family NAD(P)-dependent oxidoreductase [Lacipirellulaceae bacterium]